MKWGDLDLVRKDADLARDYERGAGAASTPRGVLYAANVSRWYWAMSATHVLAYLLTPPPRTPGQVAYEARYEAPSRTWHDLPRSLRQRWDGIAAAVLEHAQAAPPGARKDGDT